MFSAMSLTTQVPQKILITTLAIQCSLSTTSRPQKVIIPGFVAWVAVGLLVMAGTCSAQEKRLGDKSYLIIDTRSPKALWQSFVGLTDRYYQLIKDKGFTSENVNELRDLESQLIRCFDLNEVPPSLHQDVAVETAIYLREIAARFDEWTPAPLPDAEEAQQQMKEGHPPVWGMGRFASVIKYHSDGPHVGEFHFTRRVVATVPQVYKSVKSYP